MKKSMIGAVIGACLLAAPAFAHVTLERAEAPAGAGYKAVLRVGHGCDGKATRTLRVQLPDGFYNAKPMPKADWQIETVTAAYSQPFDNHGTPMTEGVREIIWSGGELPDAWYDEFVLRGTVGPEVAPGTVLYFPVVQECDDAKQEWIDVTGAEGVDNPAPGLTVTAGKQAAHAGGGQDAALMLGDLAIEGPFTRATLPGAKVAGGYLTVTNDGGQDDRLVSASTPAAQSVEIHEMTMQGDVMKMRELPDGLPIRSGQTVALKPGGYHLMMLELKQPLTEGGTVPVTLTFERAGTIEVPLAVGAPNAKGAGHAGH